MLFSCSKKNKIDIRPFKKLDDTVNNKSFDHAVFCDFMSPIVGFYDPEDSHDFYYLDFLSNAGYTVLLTAVPGVDSRLNFYNEQKDLLFRVDNNGIGEYEKIWKFHPGAGKIYIAVESKNSYNKKIPYTVNFIPLTSSENEENEPNNSFEKADSIEIGQTKKGYISPDSDIDYYKINHLEKGTVDFSVEIETLSNLDITFMIINRDNDKSVLVNDSSWGGKEQFLYIGSDKGPFYIRVSGSVNKMNNKDPVYYLKIYPEKDDILNYEREFNNDVDNSTKILLNEEIQGVITDSDIDYYHFDTINDLKTINVSVSGLSNGSVNIKLLDNDNELLYGVDNNRNLMYRNLKKGRYYIVITRDKGGNSVYKLFVYSNIL